MRLVKGVWVVLAIAALVVAGTLILTACGEDEADITRPTVQYDDQTFALLVCDGNGNSSNPWGWAHDGAEVCTLDWNNDGSGANRLPVVYVYDRYPIIDGAVTAGDIETQGDDAVWGQAPWATIPTHAVFAGGSGVTEVKAKAVFTYVNPPRIWFLFQWKDPSHTIRGDGPENNKGTMQYHWYCEPGHDPIADGFLNNRQWNSREDWLALVFSTWIVWNTADKGKPRTKIVNEQVVVNHHLADLNTSNWKCVETIPGFQTRGLNAIKGSGTTAYKTPVVTSTDMNSPYYWYYYEGAFADFWLMSASRGNYTAAGAWDATEGAYALDCYIDSEGFEIPNSADPPTPESIIDNFTVDEGITGFTTNGGWAAMPTYQAPADPGDNPPGATYMWSSSEAAPLFNNASAWVGGAMLPGYLHRPSLGSAGDIRCRFSWWDKDESNYQPYDGDNGGYTGTDPALKFPSRPHNLIAKEGYYTLEVEREIGTLDKNKPTEDVLLGIFTPHPGE